MHLLDIPLELFQQIARDVVEVAGITGAWKLRGTRFLMLTMDRYLAARLRLPLDVDQLLLEKIQSMVDWATTEADSNTKSNKDDAAENVCTGLLNVVGGFKLVYPIVHESRDERKNLTRWAEQDLGIHNKLAAALGVGSYELIKTLLPRLLEKPQEVFWLAFDPFKIAICKNDITLFQITLRILQKVAETDATRLTSIQQIQVGPGRTRLFNIADAIWDAIGTKRLGMLKALLDFSGKFCPRPSNREYNPWIDLTVSSEQSILDTLLNFKPKGGSMVTRQTLTTVCFAGSASMIQAVVTALGKNINKGSIFTLPILMAVRSGRPLAVQALLDAGADIGVVTKSNIPSISKANVTPLDVAIYHQRLDVVDVLMARGAGPLPPVHEWPMNRRSSNHLRGIVLQSTGTDLPTWNQFRNLSPEDQMSIAH
ncbi:hypothetical protein HBH69_234880 [Parastagonospora nodorum]|nr:hypothetical protein HBH42_241360 [Parastagonospora nodorum]KAH5100013.1 hypothetical protein HBH71_233380 [Parastagonospora nodorum]KAH5136782.1 hypothetical protein HBH69_234880 [Parastagonospora nodorum]KAH5290836.1 hypothetical protein HBI11_205700 [Parastagonospora nodorum]KAH6288472.1 hypothetical protein HBI39_217450 [Parastagonospora nodorum]